MTALGMGGMHVIRLPSGRVRVEMPQGRTGLIRNSCGKAVHWNQNEIERLISGSLLVTVIDCCYASSFRRLLAPCDLSANHRRAFAEFAKRPQQSSAVAPGPLR